MLWTCSVLQQILILAFFIVIAGMQPAMAEAVNFTIQPNSRVFVRNNRTFLVPCTARGGPQTIKYWRNESVLNWRVVINITNEGLWFVNDIQDSGSPQVHRVGIFRCMAENTAGVVMSKKFELSFIYLQSISVHLSSPALFDNVVRFKCNVDTNQPVKYTWFKDNVILNASKDNRLKVLPTGILQIQDYKVYDDGNYSCRAENEYKFITSSELKVVGQSTSKTTIHIYPEKLIHTKVGSSLVLECIQYSPQKSPVTWKKVTKLGTRTLANGTGFSNLVFDSVQESDAGEYRCLATDGVWKTVLLSVGAPPSFAERLPATTKQKEGGEVVLKCHVKGTPVPSVKWYKNGRVLVENSRIRFHRNRTEHRLVLKDVSVHCSGIYQCEIENKYGSNIEQTLLNVTEKMDPPYKVEVYPLSATSVNVTWKIPAGYKSVYFAIFCLDYLRKAENFQQITDENDTHYVLNFLRPYTNYAIYVMLFNTNGARGKSDPVWVRTLPSKPSGPPNEVKLTSYSYGTLDVTWIPPLVNHRNGEIISYEIKYFIKNGKTKFRKTVDKNLYTATLHNLTAGRKYFVLVAVRTKIGLGPFSKVTSLIVSKTSVGAVIPAPSITWKNISKSIMVTVTPPTNVDVKGYHMTYRLLGDNMGAENRIVQNKTTFDYELKKIENMEYVISVTAFGSGRRSHGRPAIVVVTTDKIPSRANHAMFTANDTGKLTQMRVSCQPTHDSNAIAVRWQNTPMNPEFEVKYFMLGEPTEAKSISTKYFNVTITDVLPGETYEVEVKTIFHQPSPFHTLLTPESKHCTVPDRKPDTPPSGITCNISGSSIIVKWRAPTKPNGKIRRYHIMWLDEEKKQREMEYPILFETMEKEFKFPVKNFERQSNFLVLVSAENSAGQGPPGLCSVDTSKIEGPPKQNGDTDESSSDNSDIEKGIIIGCIISVLLLFVLVMFVCWSGCRKRKASQKREGDTSGSMSYYNSRLRNQNPDTISTEVSELSSKQHSILKKFIDEETSKESDRGLGMTPKSSRLYLNSEKIPFLPRGANQGGGSVDTSCDSQDSGVQGFGKKSPSAAGAPKEPDKTPLRPEDSVVETVF